MKRLQPVLAILVLALAGCSDPTEAYTPVDELPPPPQDPVQDRVDAGTIPDDPLREPEPAEPLPPEQMPPPDPETPPPMDTVPPIDEATRPPPVDPTLEEEDPPPVP